MGFSNDDFNPEAFIQRLKGHAEHLLHTTQMQQQALDATVARVSSGPVEVVVAPGGVLRSIRFDGQPSAHSHVALTNDLMRAFHKACEQVNRLTAATFSSADLSALALASVPDDVASMRDPEERTPEAPAAGEVERISIDDLPIDPAFDRMLDEILESDDPMKAVFDHGAAPVSDPTIPASELQDVIQRDIQHSVERVEALGPELRALQGMAETREIRAIVGAFGDIVSIEIRRDGVELTAQELSEAVIATIAAATRDAEQQATDLLHDAGYDDAEDPFLGHILTGKGR